MSDNLNRIAKLTEEVDNLMSFKQQIITAVNTSHEGIAILDKDGVYTYMNEAHEKMFGYNMGELIGKSWATIYKPEDVKWFVEHVFPILEREGKWGGEATAIKKDGKTLVHEMVYLTRLPDGGLICTCRDRAFEINKWELLFERLPFGVCIASIDGYFKHINKAFIDLLGYTESELLSKPFMELIHPDDLPSTYQKIGELSTQKPVVGFVNRYKNKDGEWVKLQWDSTSNIDGQIFATAKLID